MALAATLGAAWAAAHFADHGAVPLRGPESRNATSYLVIEPANSVDSLHALPIEALRLSAHVVSLLQQLGIFTVGQLTTAPRSDLPARFGDEVLTRWDQAAGQSDELMVTYQMPPRFRTDSSIEHPTDRYGVIQGLLQQLMQRIADTLIAHSRGVLELVCTLNCQLPDISDVDPASQTTALVLHLHLSRPTHAASHLLELISMKLDRRSLPGLVEHITLEAPVTAPLERRQQVLFPECTHVFESHITRFIDRVSTRLGNQAVACPNLLQDFQPEKSFFYREPAADRPAVSSRAKASFSTLCRPIPWMTRPLFLNTPPGAAGRRGLGRQRPARSPAITQPALSNRPTLGTGTDRNRWWREHTVRRDYFRVETDQGQHLWVFHQLTDGKWFLHGRFE